ncbi:MAG TPA: hypothetical protein VN739_08980 [Nitrososphaerales archaeon]|nr:hypothetical protein [Nitrososphaerales archaeon]
MTSDQSTVDSWAQKITMEIYDYWRAEFPELRDGIKTFFTPVRRFPPLMILSLNPGGSEVDYESSGDKERFERRESFIPVSNEYVSSNYPMARKIRRFFHNHIQMLSESVAIPVIFFRSKDYSYLRSQLSVPRINQLEGFCLDKTKEILDYLVPNRFLMIGFDTLTKLKDRFGDFSNEVDLPGRETRIGISTTWRGTSVFAIRHLTGSRISNADLEVAQRMFFGSQ